MQPHKTGEFIKSLRKERVMTQMQLAEMLHISEKTVSKWETGKGLPDVGLMLPLAKALGISVNELLAGERLNDEQYVARAEENLSILLEDKCSAKAKNTVSVISFILTLVSVLGLVVICAGYGTIDTWLRVVLIVCALLALLANVSVILMLDISREVFECPACGTKFTATPAAYIAGMHTFRKRRLKCPHCGKKVWCTSLLRTGTSGALSDLTKEESHISIEERRKKHMKIKIRLFLQILVFLCAIAAMVLEALPYGVVMRWAPGPETVTESYHSYFDTLSAGYGNLLPILTAVLTCFILLFSGLTAFMRSRALSLSLFIFSVIAFLSCLLGPVLFSRFTPVTVALCILLAVMSLLSAVVRFAPASKEK